MCGIAGAFNYSPAPPVARSALQAMGDAMRARGPDGAGLWISDDAIVGLAHRRLSILDLSDRGAQPMPNVDRTLWITYNGEIYNFRELRSDLERQGVQFHTGSDTEVLLELYRSEGLSFISKLRGMFAFAIWDVRERRLLLARDPFGIKPLYVFNDGKTVRFASQVKALVAGGGIDTTPSPAAQVGFFLWGHIPEPHTIYRSIHSLGPGQAMVVSQEGGIKTWTHCDPLEDLVQGMQNGATIDPSTTPGDFLRCVLERSVRYHMIADVPVGCFLSSGIDSNVLAAFAAQTLGRERLQCITLGFEEYVGTLDDEVPAAVECAARLGVEHYVRMVSRTEFEQGLERLLDSMDQPSIDGVNTYFVAKVAAEAGLKVAISGLGADEVFGGYPTFRQVPRAVGASRWIPFASTVGPVLRGLAAPILKHFTSPKYASVLEYGTSLGGAYYLRRALFMPWEVVDLLDGEMLKEGLEQLGIPKNLDDRVSRIRTPYARVLALEILAFLQPRLLRDADWAGMAHSLEIRTPYLDAFLFRDIASLLGRASGAPSKRDLAACSPVALPASVTQRPKTGFSIPVRDWLPTKAGDQSLTRGLRGWSLLVAEHFGLSLTLDRPPGQ
jgi:asparagine synthase (glutamine-hydrolysing)